MPTRADRVRAVAELRDAGYTTKVIAAALGISVSYARELLRDPTGAEVRARKARYSKPCPHCGRPMTGSAGRKGVGVPRRCADCAAAELHENRYWTKDRIVESFRAYAAVFGRAPATADSTMQNGGAPSGRHNYSATRLAEAEDAHRLGLKLPYPWVVRREFGTWGAAIEASGLAQHPVGHRGHRSEVR